MLAEILSAPALPRQQREQQQQRASVPSPPSLPPLLDAFISAHGAAETAALCLSLVVAPPPGVRLAARDAARSALLSSRLGFRSLSQSPLALPSPGGGGGNEGLLLSSQQEFLLMQQQQQARNRPLSGAPRNYQEQQQQLLFQQQQQMLLQQQQQQQQMQQQLPRPLAAAPFAPAPGAAAAYYPLPHPNFDMGGAVALAAASEPEWSPAHRGLCALVVRELGRAWDARVVPVVSSTASSSSRRTTRKHLTKESARALEGKLRSLAAFLRSSSGSSSSSSGGGGIGIGGGGGSVGASAAGGISSHFLQQQRFLQHHHNQFLPPAAKRARLEAAAREDEAEATALVARLVQRAAEGLFLLRLLLEAGLLRLCARASSEEQQRGGGSPSSASAASLVSRMKLRDWVASKEGDAAAAALLSALIGENLSKGGGGSDSAVVAVAPAMANGPFLSLLPSSSYANKGDDNLSSALAAGCPSYFRPEERAYYRAAAALRAADDPSLSAPDRDSRACAAAALLLTAADPLSLDLTRLLPWLCRLRSWDACVDLCAAKSAALDPQRVAERIGGGGAVVGSSDAAAPASAARRDREELAYAPLAELLSRLLLFNKQQEEEEKGGKMAPAEAAATDPLSEAVASLASPAERALAKKALLSRAASRCSASDPLLVEALLAVLVEVGDVEGLLLCDELGTKGGGGGSRLVESFLRAAGGLPPMPPLPPSSGSGAAAASAPDPLFFPAAAAAASGASRRGGGTGGTFAAVGPLSASNVAAAELLARVFVARGRPAAAGAVFEALAGRLSSSSSGPSSSSSFVSLAERAEMYQCALLQLRAAGSVSEKGTGIGSIGIGSGRSSGEAAGVDAAGAADRVGVKLALVGLQSRAAQALRSSLAGGTSSAPAAEAAESSPPLESVSDLASLPPRQAADALELSLWPLPLSLSELYNDVAVPHSLWGLAIELAALAKHFRGDEPYLGQLWDVYLRDAWEKGTDEKGDGGEEGQGGERRKGAAASADDADARRASLARAALDVASRLPPGDPTIPLPLVALRLCGAAAGEWPRKGVPPAGGGEGERRGRRRRKRRPG